jgi:hypothetical protein
VDWRHLQLQDFYFQSFWGMSSFSVHNLPYISS